MQADKISTHRVIQLAQLGDALKAKASVARRCSKNLARIGNYAGANHYDYRAHRYEKIAARIAARGVEF